MPVEPGRSLLHYRLADKIGEGGMGEVWRATDTTLGRDVAIKILPAVFASDPERLLRIEREAKTVSSLNHPHICTLHDVGREGETDYLVMELVEGEALAQRLTKGPLPTAEILKLGAQIAEALDRAHRAGAVHRDLKPGNVMLTKSGAKLMDFGLARAAGMTGAAGGSGGLSGLTQSPTAAAPLTAEGTIVGTFQYMAPEQLEGKEADARSDIWALGCVFHEMATGKRAFEGKSGGTGRRIGLVTGLGAGLAHVVARGSLGGRVWLGVVLVAHVYLGHHLTPFGDHAAYLRRLVPIHAEGPVLAAGYLRLALVLGGVVVATALLRRAPPRAASAGGGEAPP